MSGVFNRGDPTLYFRDHKSWTGEHVHGTVDIPYETLLVVNKEMSGATNVPGFTTSLAPLQLAMLIPTTQEPRTPPTRKFGVNATPSGVARAVAAAPMTTESKIESPGAGIESLARFILNSDLDFDRDFTPWAIEAGDPLPVSQPVATGTGRDIPGVYEIGDDADLATFAHNQLPGGHPVIFLPGTDLRAQFELLFGAWSGVLVSDYRSNAAQTQELGTKVSDLDADGNYDPEKIAALASILRVIGQPNNRDTRSIALVGGVPPQFPKAGRGAMTTDGWLPSASVSLAPGPTPAQLVTYISESGGGPVSGGDGAADKHVIGTDDDGATHVAGHLDLRSPWYLPGFDAPPKHDGNWQLTAQRLPGFWYEVFLRYDSEDFHQAAGKDFTVANHSGLQKWQVALPFTIIDAPFPPEPKTPPEPIPGSGAFPGPSQPPSEPNDGFPIPLPPELLEAPKQPYQWTNYRSREARRIQNWLQVGMPALLFTPPCYDEAPIAWELDAPESIDTAPSAALMAFGHECNTDPENLFGETAFAGGWRTGGVAFLPPTRSLDPRVPPPSEDPESHFCLWNNSDGLQTLLSFGIPDVASGQVKSGAALGLEDGILKVYTLSEIGARSLGRRLMWKVVEVGFGDTPYTASEGESVHVDSSGGVVVVQLPPVAQVESGGAIRVSGNGSTGSNKITITADGSETINGSTTYDLNNHYQTATLERNGSGWIVVSS